MEVNQITNIFPHFKPLVDTEYIMYLFLYKLSRSAYPSTCAKTHRLIVIAEFHVYFNYIF